MATSTVTALWGPYESEITMRHLPAATETWLNEALGPEAPRKRRSRRRRDAVRLRRGGQDHRFA